MTNTGTPLEQIEKFLIHHLEGLPDVFLIEIKTAPGNKITVLLDADNGINIDTCTGINRVLYKYIEEADFFPGGNFSLEVSSPGVDRPLVLHRQYIRNIGRNVEVLFKDGTRTEGKLVAVEPENIAIEQTEGKGKKMTTKTTEILFSDIKHTTVQITF